MSKQKSARNKKYVPRAAMIPGIVFSIPMDRFHHDDVSMQMHSQIEYFIAQPCNDSILHVAHTMSVLMRAISLQSPTPMHRRNDPAAISICALVDATVSVRARLERVGRYGVSDGEAMALRAHAGVMDGVIGRVPLAMLLDAEAWVNRNTARAMADKAVRIAA